MHLQTKSRERDLFKIAGYIDGWKLHTLLSLLYRILYSVILIIL